MIRHIIIMSSSYSKGTRIALDLCGKNLNIENLISIVSKIKLKCGKEVSLSSHSIYAKSEEWQAVIESDPFFKGVKNVSDVDEFIKLIKRDLSLKGIDIAQYISSKKEYTHLELQKLSYLCYADYYCATQKKLFEDKIYAYKYGPVIESVYKFYKKSSLRDYLDVQDEEEKEEKQIESLPIKSKILFGTDGIEKIRTIDETVAKYGNFSAGELINITHRCGSPWDNTKQSDLITDDKILEYHYIEEIN